MLMAPRRTHEQQRWCQRATGREVMGAQAGNVPRPSQLYLTDRWSVGQLTSDFIKRSGRYGSRRSRRAIPGFRIREGSEPV